MPKTKRIVCLANSRKLGGRCIAGHEWPNGPDAGWTRPISGRPHHEVSKNERQYADRTEPAVLDVVDVPVLAHEPSGYQTENWLLDRGRSWKKTGEIDWDDLTTLVDGDAPLWVDQYKSKNGRNDRIPLGRAKTLGTSLTLVRVTSLQLVVFAPDKAKSELKVQAAFKMGKRLYRLRVTDPIYERRFLKRDDGPHDLGECCLTISLGEEFKGFAYKLVAAVIEREKTAS